MAALAIKKFKKAAKKKVADPAIEAREDGYSARFTDSPFGDDAIGLFALGLQFKH
jgi:hypothetical protein